MKTIKLLLGLILITCVLCFTSCSGSKDIVITDCKSDKVVAELSLSENKSEAATLTDALNRTENTNTNINTADKYLVHFIDPKDSQYDIWYYVYITEENEVYVQYDKEKMEDLNDFNKNNMDYSLEKCTTMTANEFRAIITTEAE